MRYFQAGVLLVALSVGCTTTTTAGGGTTPVSPGTAFKNCSSQAAITTAQGILGAVTQALATGNYVTILATLATQYGAAEVACAVELAVAELQQRFDNTPAAAAPDPLLVSELQNGKAWLAQYGAK